MKTSFYKNFRNIRPGRAVDQSTHTIANTDKGGDIYSREFQNAVPFNKIPGPRALPLLGNLHQYYFGALNKFKYHEVLKQYFNEYGPIFKETLVNKPIVHIYQPEMIKLLYQDEGKYPDIQPLLETSQKFRNDKSMSLGLGNSNGELWYKLRSVVQKHMMKPAEVASYLPQVNQVANEFVDKLLRIHHCHDFLMEAAKWSLESSGYISFGRRLGYLQTNSEEATEAEQMISMNDELFTVSTNLKFSYPFYKYFKTRVYKKMCESENYFADITDKYLNATLEKLENEISEGKLTAVDERYKFIFSLVTQNNLSRKDIGILTLSMFSDGLRTTTPALVSALYCLATNERAQSKLFEEVQRVVGNRSELTVTDMANMPYLKACVKEALRLYPIGLEIARINQHDLVLGGFQIPSGTTLNMNNFIMFTKEEYFNEPESFYPERWIRGSDSSVVDPFVVMPFGRGPRMCAGRRFAEQDLYIMLSKLVQNCKIHWTGGVYDQQFKILVYPDCSTPFIFEAR